MAVMAAILKLFFSLIFLNQGPGPVDLKIGRKHRDDLLI